MRRFLLPLLAALALPNAVNAGVNPEVHNLCKDVKDYMGCVQANSKKEGWNPFKKIVEEKPKNSFQPTNPEKVKIDPEAIKQRCSKGREESIKLGKIGIIEAYESCIKDLHTIGGTALDIPFEIHKRCESERLVDINSYLFCVTDNSKWKLPQKFSSQKINEFYKSSVCTQNPDYLWNGSSCIKKRKKETVYYKDKLYTASRICPDGEKMRWQTYGFRKKVEELGCMTDKEHEAYWRTAKQRKREKESQALKEAFNDLGNAINPPTVYCDSFDNGYGYSTTCKQY